jgi:hypothetical protein
VSQHAPLEQLALVVHVQILLVHAFAFAAAQSVLALHPQLMLPDESLQIGPYAFPLHVKLSRVRHPVWVLRLQYV